MGLVDTSHSSRSSHSSEIRGKWNLGRSVSAGIEAREINADLIQELKGAVSDGTPVAALRHRINQALQIAHISSMDSNGVVDSAALGEFVANFAKDGFYEIADPNLKAITNTLMGSIES